MASNAGRLLWNPRPLHRLGPIARKQHAGRMFISTKNPHPPKPIEASQEQAMPLGPYYDIIHDEPTPYERVKPEEPPTTSTATEPPPPKTSRGRKPKEEKVASSSASTSSGTTKAPAPPPSVSTSPPVPTPPPASAQQQAKVIFGSRLIGPAEREERLAEMRSRSRLIAGVLVPPRPEEPDNCCMSGCVNCVWDRYRDDMEEWATATTEAERRLQAQQAGTAGEASVPPSPGVSGGDGRGSDHLAVSMDDDGGGSETNWEVGGVDPGKIAKDLWDEELYRNIPVGIKEFMKQEKRLKEKHMREGTMGG
ncbi:Oxidoreductase-like protein [Pleurostoma richardsiae]|uniref:Oxidoreductase-like protein n=1 Tax=Pleurostoma richardsiae TaxID=41990 RepID=A0AA38RBQ0_9PEZI|nr:Oxidoreductase-like protein [Pleurostoma richardsiae]